MPLLVGPQLGVRFQTQGKVAYANLGHHNSTLLALYPRLFVVTERRRFSEAHDGTNSKSLSYLFFDTQKIDAISSAPIFV